MYEEHAAEAMCVVSREGIATYIMYVYSYLSYVYIELCTILYVIVITWARVVGLIHSCPTSEGRRSEG